MFIYQVILCILWLPDYYYNVDNSITGNGDGDCGTNHDHDVFFIICVSSLNVEESNQNLLTEPKHIVFLSQLLLLFTFCHTCKADKPEVSAQQEGTMAVITTTCHNPACKRQVRTWRSQPNMPGTQIAAGNFLLCFAILLAGASPSKVIQIFLHMGLGCVTLRTFFRYQRVRSIQKKYSVAFIF